MKISYNWLNNYLKTNYNINQLSEILNDIGLQVDYITPVSTKYLNNIQIGKIIELNTYNHYYCITIDIGVKTIMIINNILTDIKYGTKTLVATEGSVINDFTGIPKIIKNKYILNILSEGIFCFYNKLEVANYFIEGFMEFPTILNPGVTAQDIFPIKNDYIIEIGITPNRSDAMSHYGVARDLLIAIKFKCKQVFFKQPSFFCNYINKLGSLPTVYIESPKLCFRYSICLLSNLKIKKSPLWLQNILKNISITPICNILDVTNFIYYELGQPIYVYDAENIIGNNIVIKKVINNMNKHLVKNNDLIIYDEKNFIALAGISVDKYFHISKYTYNVFLECAYFDPINIRKSSKNHKLINYSSFLFERGIDFNNTVLSLKRAIYLIKHISNITYSNILDIKSQFFFYNKYIYIYYNNIYIFIGKKINKNYIKKILSLLGIKIILYYYNKLKIKIPQFRTDIYREIDIIEEILRIYGYNKIKFNNEINCKVIINKIHKTKNIEEYVINFLIFKGFYEVINISFINIQYKKLMSYIVKDLVHIISPLNKELSILRPTILFSLLERAQYNINRRNKDIKFFELGKSYKLINKKYLEKKYLSLIITNDNHKKKELLYSDNYTDFFYLKGLIESIMNMVGLYNYNQQLTEDCLLEKQLLILYNSKCIVKIGKVKKYITRYFNINQEVFYAEIDWDLFINHNEVKEQIFLEPSKFPSIRRDLSFLIDKNIFFEDIYKTIKQIEEKILKKIKLFDIYQGNKIPLGKKSYCISFYLEDDNTTLTNERVNNLLNKIKNILHKKFGALLR